MLKLNMLMCCTAAEPEFLTPYRIQSLEIELIHFSAKMGTKVF